MFAASDELTSGSHQVQLMLITPPVASIAEIAELTTVRGSVPLGASNTTTLTPGAMPTAAAISRRTSVVPQPGFDGLQPDGAAPPLMGYRLTCLIKLAGRPADDSQ